MSKSSGCRYDNECVKLNVLYFVGCISIFSYILSNIYKNLLLSYSFLLVAVLAYSELVYVSALWHAEILLSSAGTKKILPPTFFFFLPSFELPELWIRGAGEFAFIKPHSGNGSGVLVKGEKGGCRNGPVPSASPAGRLVSWYIQLKRKLGVFQQAVLLYLR